MLSFEGQIHVFADVARFLIDQTFATFSTLSAGTRRRLLNTHGYFGGLAIFLFLRPAYDQLDRMEDHVLWASEDVVEKCRQTYMQECNMSAVAGTIIAQVALTSLVLPNLSQTHWVARAAFLLSLVSGCLAVYYASLLQRTLGNFRTPEQVREWWRCSRSAEREARATADMPLSEMFLSTLKEHGQDPEGKIELDFWRTILNMASCWGDRKPKLQASVAAAILMSSPSMMINFALGAFLIGIGIYLGFMWQNDLDTLAGIGDSRNVFVCFLLSLGFCYSFYLFPSLSKLWEDNKKTNRGTLHGADDFLDAFFRLLKRIARIQQQELNVEMMSKLLPYMKKLATGVSLGSWDERWISEAMRMVEETERLLDTWKFPRDLGSSEHDRKDEEDKTKEKWKTKDQENLKDKKGKGILNISDKVTGTDLERGTMTGGNV